FDRLVCFLESLELEESGDLAHSVSSHAATFFCASSASARRYSLGKTLTNFARYCAHLSGISAARLEPVYLRWFSIRRFSVASSSASASGSRSTIDGLQRFLSSPSRSST